MEESSKTYRLIINFPCKNGADTVGIMRSRMNITLLDGTKIVRVGHPYQVPYSFSREEAIAFANDLKRVGTESQILSSDGTPLTF